MHYQFIDRYCQERNYTFQSWYDDDTHTMLNAVNIDEKNIIALFPVPDPDDDEYEPVCADFDVQYNKEDGVELFISLRNPSYEDFERLLDLIVSLIKNQK